jgi:hypothetical protein
MADKRAKVELDIPDMSKLEEHGVLIDAPTPSQFVLADPWAPTSNGQPMNHEPPAGPPPAEPAAGTDDA